MAWLFLLGFGVLLFLLNVWSRRFRQPTVDFSSVKTVQEAGWQGKIPEWLMWGGFGLLLLAFIDPHVMLPKQGQINPQGGSLEGIGIYLILDQSGSMGDPVRQGGAPKMDYLKKFTRAFIQGDRTLGLLGRPNDLLGIVAFARGAQVLVPLTLDHRAVIEALEQLQVNNDQDQDGTAIGYAIFKTTQMIAATRQYAAKLPSDQKPAFDIKSTAMILVTDGLQDPSDKDKGKRFRTMDIPEAASYAKNEGIHLYIVNVDPEFAAAKYEPNRHQMERAAASTGGKFFLADSSTDLADIYNSIDSLEKSRLPSDIEALPKDKLPHYFKRVSFYPFLIGIALLALLTALILRATVFKVFP